MRAIRSGSLALAALLLAPAALAGGGIKGRVGYSGRAPAKKALDRAWTKPTAMIREGGSIPVMTTFQRTHGLPSILMGFGLHDDQIHAPNEKFSLTSFHGGTRSCAYLYEELGR